LRIRVGRRANNLYAKLALALRFPSEGNTSMGSIAIDCVTFVAAALFSRNCLSFCL